MKWYVCESRNGDESVRLRADSAASALRAARRFAPSVVTVREEADIERLERESRTEVHEGAARE